MNNFKYAVLSVNVTIRYDTRNYFNVRSKADMSQLNRPRGTKLKSGKGEKIKKTDMLRSIGKQPGESVESVRKKKRKATVGRICTKRMFCVYIE